MKDISIEQANLLVGIAHYDKRNSHESIKLLADVIFCSRPDLIPFTGGDRAEKLGFESAAKFAERKIKASEAISANTRMRKRLAEERKRNMSTDSKMS